MAYGKVNIDTIQSSTAGTPPQFNDGNGTQTGTLCRAWVNFNGTGTVAIRASFNVSSITDSGTGAYVVNFTNSLPDANYAAVMSATLDGNTGSFTTITTSSQYTTTALSFNTKNQGGTLFDPTAVSVAVFR